MHAHVRKGFSRHITLLSEACKSQQQSTSCLLCCGKLSRLVREWDFCILLVNASGRGIMRAKAGGTR